jgi:hypothetical protein
MSRRWNYRESWLTVTGVYKLLICRMGAFLVYGLSTDHRLDGCILKVRNVGPGGKRIIRRSTKIVDVEVDLRVCLNWALSLVVADMLGKLASGVSVRTVASLKSGKAELVVRMEVRSSLCTINERTIGIREGIVDVSLELKFRIKLQSPE